MVSEEAIKQIQDTAVEAAGLEQKELLGDSRRVLIAQGDRYEMVELQPPDREHRVETVADLMAAAVHWSAASVWHTEDRVLALLDDTRRSDRVICPLVRSESCLILGDAMTRQHGQKQFVELLRSLRDCLSSPAVIEPFRTLDFYRHAEATGTVKQGDESMGRQLHQRVATKQGELPEQIRFDLRWYSNLGESFVVGIVCDVIVDVEDATFRLQPTPDAFAKAAQAAQAELHQRLVEGLPEGVPIFYGSPD